MDLFILIVLLTITYFSGRWVEHKHVSALNEKETATKQIPILNIEEDPFDLQHGVKTRLVSAHVSLSADYFRSFLIKILSLFGMPLHVMESLSDRARREIFQRLQFEATKATYITGVRIETIKESPGIIEMVAIGTAVYNDPEKSLKLKGYRQFMDHTVNAPRTSPIRDFIIFGGATAIFILVVLKGVDPLAHLVPVSTEDWLWSVTAIDYEIPDQSQALKKEQKNLQILLDKLPKSEAMKSYNLKITLVNDPTTINAVSLPGQRIIIYTGLLDAMTSENELVFILAHEMAHFENRDHAKQLMKIFVENLLALLLGGDFAQVNNAVGIQFSQQQEKEADLLALKTLVHYYGHAGGATEFFELEKQEKEVWAQGFFDLFASHPNDAKRVAYLQDMIQREGYKLEETLKPSWQKFELENLSVAELVERYPYIDLYRINESLGTKYYKAYEEFYTLWTDKISTTNEEMWIDHAEKTKKLNRQFMPYHIAMWERYFLEALQVRGREDLPVEIKTKLEKYLILLQMQLDAEVEVLSAHQGALQFLAEHDTWSILERGMLKIGYKGGSAEFEKFNGKIPPAEAKRNKIMNFQEQYRADLLAMMQKRTSENHKK